jgi:hypothetical protein
MRLSWLLTFLIFAGCNNQNSSDLKMFPVDSLKPKLQGNWGRLGEDGPVWEINGDSIYYYQEKKAYHYQIVDKDLTIERPEFKADLRNISVVEDTMTFNDDQGLTINAYRFEAKNKIKKN